MNPSRTAQNSWGIKLSQGGTGAPPGQSSKIRLLQIFDGWPKSVATLSSSFHAGPRQELMPFGRFLKADGWNIPIFTRDYHKHTLHQQLAMLRLRTDPPSNCGDDRKTGGHSWWVKAMRITSRSNDHGARSWSPPVAAVKALPPRPTWRSMSSSSSAPCCGQMCRCRANGTRCWGRPADAMRGLGPTRPWRLVIGILMWLGQKSTEHERTQGLEFRVGETWELASWFGRLYI